MWELRTASDYDASCTRCEKHVTLATQKDRRTLLRALRWRKSSKQQPIAGRVVVEDVRVCGVELCIGDRVEPSEALVDVAKLDSAPLPLHITLWRTHKDRLKSLDPVAHRCPIFDARIGTSPRANLAVDELHCLYFGPIMRYISAVLWRVALSNRWRFQGTLDQIVDLSVRQLSAELL